MSDSEENKDVDQKKMGILEKFGKGVLFDQRHLRNRGNEEALLGNLEFAIEAYDEIFEIWGPKNAEIFAMKAHVTSMMGDDDEAIELYNKSLEVEPKRCWTWMEKGMLLEDLERFSEAVLCYHKALEHVREGFRSEIKARPDPPKVDILGALSHAYFHAGTKDDLRLAEKYMKEAFEIEPEHRDAQLTKAHLLIEEEKWKQVLEICEIILNDDEDEDFLQIQAEAHLVLKNSSEAFDSITRLLAIDESIADYWFLFARYYALVKKYEEVIDKLIVALHLGLELGEETSKDPLFDYIKTMPEFERLLKLQDDIFMP